MNKKEFQIIKERVQEKEIHEDIKKPKELLIKETIGERIEEGLKNLPPTVEQKIPSLSPSTLSEEAFKKEVEDVVKLAFEKNIPYAVNLVRKSGKLYLLDALHDALVKYYIENPPSS